VTAFALSDAHFTHLTMIIFKTVKKCFMSTKT